MTKKQRKDVLRGSTPRISTGCGNLYVTLNEDEGKLDEILARLGKPGGCPASFMGALGRMVTYCIRLGGDLEYIMNQLRGTGCNKTVFWKGETILSCSDAIGKILENYLKHGFSEPIEEKKPITPSKEEIPKVNMDKVLKDVDKAVKETPVKQKVKSGACPECQAILVHEEGCEKCQSCGFTRC